MSPERSPALYERAILWVSHPPLLAQRVGGLSVLERQLFTAARAGIKQVWIGIHQPDAAALGALRVPPGLTVRWVPKGTDSLVECAPPYVGLSSDHLVRVETLAHVVRQRYPESVSFDDASGLGVIQAVLTRDDAVTRAKHALPEGSYRRLEAPLAGEETVTWLMAAGPKAQDGFMARHFDRHISLAVSRVLLETPVTPNMMTLFSTALGLAGAALFLGSSRAWYVPGAALVWLHSVLDGCDGHLPRTRLLARRSQRPDPDPGLRRRPGRARLGVHRLAPPPEAPLDRRRPRSRGRRHRRDRGRRLRLEALAPGERARPARLHLSARRPRSRRLRLRVPVGRRDRRPALFRDHAVPEESQPT
ncbi:MAG: CDP-alcohol phosphatidyltransferase family protein [Elusimicrobia bacterium]|nr:CDP-alcohol phosphatidyltransferase family protein [Elusimicrobiota bacterium]